MATYLWKGVDRFGTERFERVEAESAREAKEKLEVGGFTQLRLHSDEIVAAAKEGVEQASDPEYRVQLTAQEEIERFGQPPPGLWESWWGNVCASPKSALLSLAVLVYGLYVGSKWMVAIPVVGFLFYPVVFYWLGLPTRIYEQLNRAKVWHRWTEVQACCGRLERVMRWVRMGPPAWEIARCRGQALAAMGRLEEGLQEFARHETDPLLPKGMYHSFQAGIHDAARSFDQAVELRARSVESMPDNMSLKVDLAMGYVQRKRDPARAKAILETVDPELVVEFGRPWLQLIRGLIALEEGDLAGARELFKGALAGFEPYSGAPLVLGVQLLTKSYLCLALALDAVSDRAQARELYKEVGTFLEAVREVELLGRIRTALG